ncbi:hypothetical protein EPICR_50287 [Candidatus Desulfarcum epimagneticum]|uniref:Glycosyltransferase 2-like domain-containing protein n=1 Tax=uncultured Desulfobacteraceae bacterium TaxID=218296 RepID=A0A484HKR0_9BACT|nr:hypothetical protein EPICR_50287 [uncultured Desulfobacteraceae bacterium]
MVSVIVTTKNQEDDVEPCLLSVIRQDYDKDFEIIVIDDASRDHTVDIVKKKFKNRVRIIEKSKPRGWLDSLSRACETAKEDILIFFDPHCAAAGGWLGSYVSCFESDPDVSVISGPLRHTGSFLHKLCLLTYESLFLPRQRRYVHYVENDNFAIKKNALKNLLPCLPINHAINASPGGALLSAEFKKQSITVLYEPGVAVLHQHHPKTFLNYLKHWASYSADTSVVIRKFNPSASGAQWLSHPLIAAMAFPCARFISDIRNIFRFKKELGVKTWQIPFFLLASAVGKLCYGWGLIAILIKDKELKNF